MERRAKGAYDGAGGEEPVLASWQPPAIVAIIAVAIVGAFYLGGPGLGLATGALAAAGIVAMAARAAPRGPIVPAPLTDLRRHILIVSRYAIEDPLALTQIAELSRDRGPDPITGDLRLLVPVRERFLDRWCSDRVAHSIAQRNCVISLAGLATVGLEASAAIGDGDLVQAVEDELRTYPATDVLMLTRAGSLGAAERSAFELRARLQADFLQLPVQATPVEDRGSWRVSSPAVGPPARSPRHRGSSNRP